MIPNRTGAEVNDPRPVNLTTFAIFGEICLATGSEVSGVPSSPTLGSGSGVPTHVRPDGSVFLRTDGATGSTVYTVVSGAWVPIDSGGTAISAQYLDDLLGHTLTAEDGELNTAARHDQNTDQFLDEGGLNQSTAADVKDAVDRAHTQGTDQYLDEGGANQSTAADVADAVSLRHTQGTDQGLDTGGANQSTAADVKDAVDRAHDQGTDQGLDTGGPNAVTAADVASAVGDSHVQGTDQGLDTGGPNQSTAADVADAVSLRHDQGTDQYLDLGGLSEVTAAEVKAAVGDSHVQGTDQYLDEGGANEVTAADAASAVSLKHTQGTDQFLDEGGASEVTAANAASAVALKHTQNSDTYLDEGGANEVTAADAADAVALKHTQNSDTYLDEGGANEVTAADAASAVSLKHARSHALDSSSDHSIGAGAEGQCIGVVAGPALGWVTPLSTPQGVVSYDFPVARNWKTSGAGTAGLWTGSSPAGAMSDWATLEFASNELNFSCVNPGADKRIYFEIDLSAYLGLWANPSETVGLVMELTTLGNDIDTFVAVSFGEGAFVEMIDVSLNGSVGLIGSYAYDSTIVYTGSTAVGGTATTEGRLIAQRVNNTLQASWFAGTEYLANNVACYPHLDWTADSLLRIDLGCASGTTLTGTITQVICGPLCPK